MKKIRHFSLAIVLLLPFFAMIYLSFTEQWAFPQLFRAHYTLFHWRETLFGGNKLLLGFKNSLLIAGSISISASLCGFFVSRYIMYHRYGKQLLSLAYFPYLIAPVIFGILLQYYFIKIGLSGTIYGVLFSQALFIFPYSILFFASFWNENMRQLSFQATTLGATTAQIFYKIWIPLAKPWLFLCVFQCFLISWFEYGITRTIGIGKVSTLPIQVIQYTQEGNPHVAAVASCLMVFPALIFLLINRKIFLKKIENID